MLSKRRDRRRDGKEAHTHTPHDRTIEPDKIWLHDLKGYEGQKKKHFYAQVRLAKKDSIVFFFVAHHHHFIAISSLSIFFSSLTLHLVILLASQLIHRSRKQLQGTLRLHQTEE